MNKEIVINDLLGIFYRANRNFIVNTETEILRNISERSLCSTLSWYLNIELSKSSYAKYFCDVEYNRNNQQIKTIYNDFNFIPVVCDLIIHSRGRLAKDNLLALEMKKSTHPQNKKEEDRQRLIALTIPLENDQKVYGVDYVRDYFIGIYYEINIKKKTILMEYYIHNEKEKMPIYSEQESFDYYKVIPKKYE